MNLGFEYIKYRWKAKGRHGIHSPFIYDFADQCLPIHLNINEIDKIIKLQSKLKVDSSSLQITDAGAGSKKLGQIRKVQDIYKTSSSKGKYGELLYKIVKHYSCSSVLEMGTSLGVGTGYMALASPTCKITTIDACKETIERAQKSLSEAKLNQNITFVHQRFIDFLEESDGTTKYDLIFVDGHHDGAALSDYMQLLQKVSHDQTLFILDDIRWSSSMLKAWKDLSHSNDYHVAIDLFRFGILLKRPEQEKENFILRY